LPDYAYGDIEPDTSDEAIDDMVSEYMSEGPYSVVQQIVETYGRSDTTDSGLSPMGDKVRTTTAERLSKFFKDYRSELTKRRADNER
jgi:hypothetical protein